MKREIETYLPIISQIVEFQNSPRETRSSYYDHTKKPLENIAYSQGLKERLVETGIPVKGVAISIADFERWLSNFHELTKHYEKMGDVFIEKCLEHYLAFRHLNISPEDIYIDVASAGNPWAEILNGHGVKSYRLDLAYPKKDCDQSKVTIEPEAKRVWRDDEYKVPFARHYSPESFSRRIWSEIPEDMRGKILYFQNFDEVMEHYPGQKVYCFFMFLCEKRKRIHKNSVDP